MSNKRKGFTLVEVIVVILVSTVLLTMVIGAMTYINNTIGDFIQQAEDIEMAKNIEKYIRGIDINDLTDENIEIIYENTELESFKIDSDSKIIKCYMKFYSGLEFNFVVGINDNENEVN